jgi:hypothetical protein
MIRQLTIILAVPLALASSADLPHQRDMTLDLPNSQVRVHHESNVELMVTNFGFFGSLEGMFADPEEPEDNTNGFEIPADSGIEYLFQGALWIGAEIDTVDSMGNPILDTLVSVGNDSWWSQVYELYPPPVGYTSLWEDNYQSDEDIHAVYYDTVTDARYVVEDPNDQRPHIPLGLKIHQVSYAWNTRGFDEFIIVDFYVENIGARLLHNVWLGLYLDGDVYHFTEPLYTDEWGAQDDLCGYLDTDDHGIAWISDNNGQPYNGLFEQISPRSAIGLKFLWATEPNIQTNFNYWTSHIDSMRDWGPQRVENYHGPYPGGGRGTPGGDKAKYQVMSNGERDYDQARSALSHPGWIDPPPYVTDIANGWDTRFLISFGPIAAIQPGQIDTITLAFIAGRNLHNDPANYADHLLFHETDSAQVDAYYAGLDFSDLIAKADSLDRFYAGGVPRLPIGAPHNLRAADWSTNFVRLAWNPRLNPSLAEYRLFRGIEPGVYNPVPLTPPDFLDTSFTDNNVVDNVRYYYVIASVDTGGWQGRYSPEVMVNTGQPHPPTGLSAASGQSTRVTLDWNNNPESDIAGYEIYRAEALGDFTLITSVDSSFYIDIEVANGVTYRYRVTAFDILGNVSGPSNIAQALPMGFDSGILLINENISQPGVNPQYDSMAAFYSRVFEDYGVTFTSVYPYLLSQLAPFSVVIITHDLLRGRYPFPDYHSGNNSFDQYLDAGGKLLFLGPKHFVPVNGRGLFSFAPSDFAYRYLNLAAAEYPASIFESQFIGGASVAPGFDDFDIDTARANAMTYPLDMNIGRLSGIGTLVPIDSSEVIYSYIAAAPESTVMENRPIGVVHITPTYKTATLDAPLFYMNELDSRRVIRSLLVAIGEPVNAADDNIALPGKTALIQNYPNPFNARTIVSFTLESPCDIRLSIYNIVGQRVAVLWDGPKAAGSHTLIWDATPLPSGLYFARLETPETSRSVKMILVK